MTKETLHKKANEAFKLNEELKATKKKLDGLKQEIKDYCESKEIKAIETGLCSIALPDVNVTSIDIQGLFDIVPADDIKRLVTPSTTAVRKYLSEHAFNSITKTVVAEYSKITFKKAK